MCTKSFWIEIITLLYQLSYSMIEPSIKVHIYESMCAAGNFTNASICEYLPVLNELEDAVQKHAASYMVYMKLLRSLPALITIIFCGAWSDNIGRKMPLLFPFVGMLLSLIVYLVSFAEKVETLSTCLVGGTVSGLFGEVGLILMAGYSYITDVTETQDRTRRLGRLMAMSFFGQFLGSLIAAIMLKVTDVHNVFILATVLTGISIVVIIIFLQDSLTNKSEHGKASSSMILCRTTYLMETWQVIAKPREHKKRLYICMILSSIALHQACLSGELDVTMLYVRHSPLNWHAAAYGYFLAGGFLCSGVGTLVLVPILSGHFSVNDFALVMSAVGFKVVQVSWMAFSAETWMIYFGLPMMVVSAMFIPALKSVLSKLIKEDEVGKIFGLSALGETLSGLFGALMFTSVYGASVDIFPGLAFILEALANIAIFGMILWLSSDFMKHNHTLLVEDAGSKQALQAESVHVEVDDDWLEHASAAAEANQARPTSMTDTVSHASGRVDSDSDESEYPADSRSLRREDSAPNEEMVPPQSGAYGY